MSIKDTIVIFDFGSQFTQLIARRIRELNIYSEIVNHSKIRKFKFNNNIKGIILSGGPSDVNKLESPKIGFNFFNLNIPILGICYGHQLISKKLGGKIKSSTKREFGFAKLIKHKKSLLIDNFFSNSKNNSVWMSHQDIVSAIPSGFERIAYTQHSKNAVIQNKKKRIYGIQFHPEVSHTKNGKILLKNFVLKICKAKKSWNLKIQKKLIIDSLKFSLKNQKIICGLSGGVDSAVTALLLKRAIGKNLICVFVDTGLLRKNEPESIINFFRKKSKLKLIHIDAKKIFYSQLKNVSDPERKRKIIGKLFIKIFEQNAKKIKNVNFLAQGTLYPDLIESKSQTGGGSSKIKSHHNVGGLPKKMKFKLIEPLKSFYKDEVRKLGKQLNLDPIILKRHPFPGPGLAIRIIGEVNKEKIKILQNADEIFMRELKKEKLYDKIWQAYAALLPHKTVGVMGDKRTYEFTCLLRAVVSEDGMTADFYKFTGDFLGKVSNQIVNSVPGINRVVYDITSKPPSTIEQE